MRNILFRGKRIDNGKWVEGYYGEFHNRPTIQEENSCQIFEPREDAYLCGSCIGGLWHIIKRKTVGQFTGLTDKNGKKVFENDIIVICYETDGEEFSETKRVHYNEKECCWYPMRWEECCEYCDHYTEVKSIEVIGNIHDNPELLEVTDNA